MFKTRVALALAASGALLLSACGGGDGSGSSGDEVTIAVAGPMTGENAVYGINQKLGVEFAAKQINDAGGIPSGPLEGKTIKVETFDDIADPNQGASVAQKICDDGDIIAVFGHSNSSVTLAAMPIYERCGVPLIVSYSSNPEITAKLTPNVFRTLIDDASMGAEMAFQMANDLGAKKVGLLASPDDYGQGLTDAFKGVADEAGLDLAEAIITTQGQKDYTPQLTSLRNAGVDTIGLMNTYVDAALQIKQARAMGWDDVTFVGTGGSNNPELISIGSPEATEGSLVQAIFDPTSSAESVQSFITEYTEGMGEAPNEPAAVAYDSFFVFLQALEDGAEDRDSVISAMADRESFELPLRGEFTFDENQGAAVNPDKASTSLLVVKDGQFVSQD